MTKIKLRKKSYVDGDVDIQTNHNPTNDSMMMCVISTVTFDHVAANVADDMSQ